MLWDPFLIKKLLKIVIYGTREQCTNALFTVDKVNYCGLNKKKKKKKREKRKGETQTLESLQSKRAQGHPADLVVPTNKNNTSQIKMLTSFKLSSSATIAK